MIRHNALRAAMAAGFALGFSGLAQAQDAAVPPGEQPVDPYVQSNANAGAAPMSDKAVFEAFHGREGLARITSDLVDRNLADPRIKDIFATADVVRLKRTLTEQFCYVLGGGCDYTGKDMTQAHKDQGITPRDFNALVENLQWAMDKEGVPFAAQNKLLAKLAPMARQTVERK
ncbi:group 1 truncated hemoglobin [Caulobacter sp. D4A]|uniref:group I truncated hemoglobin n=1 Tax=unclassified Caulobacter TaxID=2648921 RepID=UPI000D725E3F|nr:MULTISPECIES: group 1 truncated hemoglobin [unclassified Caulobacter]PXA82392.1 group 1 truncated hemoglobin [Caulobacter sp. D4A]PXA95202.1 group 1 truncated hemoglobin [Caulobacter sp. D5]